MGNVISVLEAIASKAIQESFGSELPPDSELLKPEITQSTQSQFGHYQCNNALKLAKALKKNPREVAARLIAHFAAPFIEKLEAAGPGFINITLSSAYLAERIHNVLIDERLGVPLPAHRQRIIVEFSSPNIAKELHVGHIRSTIIGDALARLFEFLGHNVLRLNHVGDWGTQFGMLITYMQEHAADVLSGSISTDLSHLLQWYKASKKRFDEDPDFKKRAQLKVVDLQSGDSDTLRAWRDNLRDF